MENELRERLLDLADGVPPQREMPPGLGGRARRRMAVTAGGTFVVAVALVVASVVGVRALTRPRSVPANPGPRPAYHHNGEIAVGRFSGIYAIDPRTGASRRLVDCSDPISEAFCHWTLAWSPDGKELVYADRWLAGSAPEGGVWVLDAATGRSIKIASLMATEVSWSPDGTRIAFSYADRLELMDPDGGHVRTLGPFAPARPGASDFGFHFAWSPDGSHLAVSNEETLLVIDHPDGARDPLEPDGSHRRTLIRFTAGAGLEPGVVEQPTWSPDGAKIAFVVDSRPPSFESGKRLYVIGSDAADPKLLVDATSSKDWIFQPTWSPDGTSIAYIGGTVASTLSGRSLIRVMVVAVAGGPSTELVSGGSFVGNGKWLPGLGWSPDGTKITAVLSSPRGWGDLYAMNRDGSDPLLLVLPTQDPPEGKPTWQPVP